MSVSIDDNPASCAIGFAVLDELRAERPQQHAPKAGRRLHAGLARSIERHPLIDKVRGAGLFVGAELVCDRETLEPTPAEAAEMIERMEARGILLSTDGPLHNVIKMKPPMVLTEDDIDIPVLLLDDELSLLERG